MTLWKYWWGETVVADAVTDESMPLARILSEWLPSSRPQPWGWDDEERDVTTRRVCACCGEVGHHQQKLEAYISELGLVEGVVLGGDGRVWDGHHRIVAARRLGIEIVPLESAEASSGRWLRDYGPVSWQERASGDFSPEEWEYLSSLATIGPEAVERSATARGPEGVERDD